MLIDLTESQPSWHLSVAVLTAKGQRSHRPIMHDTNEPSCLFQKLILNHAH